RGFQRGVELTGHDGTEVTFQASKDVALAERCSTAVIYVDLVLGLVDGLQVAHFEVVSTLDAQAGSVAVQYPRAVVIRGARIRINAIHFQRYVHFTVYGRTIRESNGRKCNSGPHSNRQQLLVHSNTPHSGKVC